MGQVCFKDGYFHNVIKLLEEPKGVPFDDSYRRRKSECARKLKTLITDKCKGTGDFRQTLMKVEGLEMTQHDVATFLDTSAATMLKGIGPKLSEQLLVDSTVRSLILNEDLPPTIEKFRWAARELHNALTFTLPHYAPITGTSALAQLGRGVAFGASGDETAKPLVIVSWNIKAGGSCFLTSTAHGFVARKVTSIAKIAEQERASLLVLQECPSDTMKTSEKLINVKHFTTSLLKEWKYCEAQTGGEAAGFLYDPLRLELLAGPAAYPNRSSSNNSSRSDFRRSNPEAVGKCEFQRPPVLSIFVVCAQASLESDLAAAAARDELIVVVSVHLKCPEDGSPHLPRSELLHLGSTTFQGWIEQHIVDAKGMPGVKLNCPHSVLIIGDFNLAATYREDRDHSDFPDYASKTNPGLAWNDLLGHGYECLLRACDKTNGGKPFTKETYAYDNAAIRFSVEGIKSPVAFVGEIATEELAQWKLAQKQQKAEERPAPLEGEDLEDETGPARDLDGSTDFEGHVTQAQQKEVFTSWSDHRPIVVHI